MSQLLWPDVRRVPEPSSNQRQESKQMEDLVVESSFGAGSEAGHSSRLEDLKQKIFLPCLDGIISEIDKRFSDANEELLSNI